MEILLFDFLSLFIPIYKISHSTNSTKLHSTGVQQVVVKCLCFKLIVINQSWYHLYQVIQLMLWKKHQMISLFIKLWIFFRQFSVQYVQRRYGIFNFLEKKITKNFNCTKTVLLKVNITLFSRQETNQSILPFFNITLRFPAKITILCEKLICIHNLFH